MHLEEQLAAYQEIQKKIHELKEQKKAFGDLIIQQMTEKRMQVGDKLSIKVARPLGALLMKETMDRAKLKELYLQGHSIEGVTEASHIQVTKG